MADRLYIDVGKRLAGLRAHFGFATQDEFADWLGIAGKTYNNYETGVSRPSVDNAGLIAQRTGVTTDWIFWGAVRSMPPELIRGIGSQAGEARSN